MDDNIAAQKRGRAGYGGRRRQKPRRSQQQKQQQQQQEEEQQQLEPPSQTPSDEESTDSGSVTRCVCQESHNVGLMVQCDQCEVWQHCECMGLGEQDIPEHYYCEQCKPENHAPKKVTRRAYNSSSTTILDGDKRVTKKRMTFNSREASMSLEDVLAARSALEFPLDRIKSESPPDSPKEETTVESDRKEEEKATHTQENRGRSSSGGGGGNNNRNNNSERDTPAKDDKGSDSEMTDLKDEQGLVTQTMHAASPGTPSSLPASAERSTTAATTPAASAKPKRPTTARSRSDESSRATKEPKRPKPTSRRSTASARRAATAAKSRSRTSTPQPTGQTSDETPTETDISTSLFDKLSQCARDTSPPAKVRYPSARMTISEMNKRAKQILEYISSIQVEMATTTITTNGSDQVQKADVADGATKTDESTRRGKKPDAIVIPGKTEKGPSSSLSSASTIPLEEPLTAEDGADESTEALYREKSVAQETLDQMNETTGESGSNSNLQPKKEQTSMEIMDMLTGELIRFQRRFGSVRSRHHDTAEDESMSESEEPAPQDDPFPPEQAAAHV
ncbi:hypothetical protein BCR43DRAFT_511598 [Syncephalastrum racemosum]|uniref:Zinc finger PHD-type domain-containing protein n=1 Tax=Syncephalastrum racemosum TaxID=13706 RepID=A0A1X2HMR5_SYNRA|nr:hypothetical protein BCR43DRAFT_511598 [Syncephalastrum racemosum]